MNAINKLPLFSSIISAWALAFLSANAAHAQTEPDTPEADPIEHACFSEAGECVVFAEEGDANGSYTAFSSECSCRSGMNWGTEFLSRVGRSFETEFVQDLCKEALDNCIPPRVPGPAAVQIYDPENVYSRYIECGQEGVGERADSNCILHQSGREVETRCECAGAAFASTIIYDPEKTNQELYQQCLKEMATCGTPSDDQSQNPKQDCPMEDIKKSLGCTLSGSPSGFPVSMALGALLLGGLTRRNRRTHR